MIDKGMSEKERKSFAGKYMAVILELIICTAVYDLIRYAVLGQLVSMVTILVIGILFSLLGAAAYAGRCPVLYLPITAVSLILFFIMDNWETTRYNYPLLLQTIWSVAGFAGGTGLCVKEKEKWRKDCRKYIALAGVICLIFGCYWQVNDKIAVQKEKVSSSVWNVPAYIDQEECVQGGTLEELTYETYAYATDMRKVEKKAWVYVPYGYDADTRYNILYLLHGTGEDEKYWMVDNQFNKRMVDNMIFYGNLDPLIIVMPTFYVENDCAENLEPLTYSFVDELRNDLMPAVEGKYSTYADSCEEKDFVKSRDHRAFAGLSRGAVTTLRSVFCGALDYFSYFGTFSASRIHADYFKEHIQSQEFKEYGINYWYVASGNFDFGLQSQIEDYKALLKIEPRLVKGENTELDVYPMRYHSMGNWHLALYNYLQKIF